MMKSTTEPFIRMMAGLTAAVGIVLVSRPRTLSTWSAGSGRAPDIRIIRVLGGRQVVQGVVQIVRPGRGLVAVGALVDTLHLLSMVAAAVVWPRYRRPALISAGVAGAFAGAGAAILAADGRALADGTRRRHRASD